MVFFGEYTIKVTEGGRVALPKKIRECLIGSECILTKGFNMCLAGYARPDWDVRSRDLMKVSLLDTDNIDRRRKLFSGASEIAIDEQGRVVLPKSLLEFLNLQSDVVKVIGVGDHFELWDEASWNGYSLQDTN